MSNQGGYMVRSLNFISTLVLAILVSMTVSAFSAPPTNAETRIASWNIKRLRADNKDYAALASVVSHFDFVGIQEVMEEDGLMRLMDELQDLTGSEWGVMSSHAIGRGSYKERYAFIWRKSHISFVDSAVVYLDSRDVFAREPLSARFRTTDGETFIASNIHVLYGDGKSDRRPEIDALAAYWSWLGETFPDEQYFLMGDFNMVPDDRSFERLDQFATPLVTQGATTLSTTDGEYANLYDNIWVPDSLDADIQSGIFALSSYFEADNETIRATISDHAPVFMVIDNMDETTGLFDPADDVMGPSETGAVDTDAPTIRGNENSQIFHVPGCTNYEQMADSPNLIGFETVVEAQQAGYRIAGNC